MNQNVLIKASKHFLMKEIKFQLIFSEKKAAAEIQRNPSFYLLNLKNICSPLLDFNKWVVSKQQATSYCMHC